MEILDRIAASRRFTRTRVLLGALGAFIGITMLLATLPAQSHDRSPGIVLPGEPVNHIQGQSFSGGSGDLEVVFHATSDNWDRRSNQTVLARATGKRHDHSVVVQIRKSERLLLRVKDRSGEKFAFRTPPLGLQDGKGYWFRVRFDAQYRSESTIAHFWVGEGSVTASPSDVNWGSAVASIEKPGSFVLWDSQSASAAWEVGSKAQGRLAVFDGALSYVEYWANGWNASGARGKQVLSLDLRDQRNATSADMSTWRDGQGRRWNVIGNGWKYQSASSNPGTPTTTAADPTTTVPVEDDPTTTTTVAPTTTTTKAPTTTTTKAPNTTTTTAAPPDDSGDSSGDPVRLVITKDTVYRDKLVLRPGDTVELRNGARLEFADGGSADWQGSPTSTWSKNGQVQNLTRDVKIFGKGDIRFSPGSKKSTIRFVEIDLQPRDELGRYPLHWHHVGDASRGTLVEGVVIKNSTNRAYVPHASHGITFKDNIAKNVVRQGFWWDPPCECDGASKSRFHTKNNSNDTTVVRMLIDGVKVAPNGDGKHGLTAYMLGAGRGNVIRDSVAMNVEGRTSASGFQWPSSANLNEGGNVWVADNLRAYNVHNGIFVWQNDFNKHVITNFSAWNTRGVGIDHGAYLNAYRYENPNVDSMKVHALGEWVVVGGRVGTVHIDGHNKAGKGTGTFTNTSVDKVIVANGGGAAPGHFVFKGTGLTCGDVKVESLYPGSSIVIDGKTCKL